MVKQRNDRVVTGHIAEGGCHGRRKGGAELRKDMKQNKRFKSCKKKERMRQGEEHDTLAKKKKSHTDI